MKSWLDLVPETPPHHLKVAVLQHPEHGAWRCVAGASVIAFERGEDGDLSSGAAVPMPDNHLPLALAILSSLLAVPETVEGWCTVDRALVVGRLAVAARVFGHRCAEQEDDSGSYWLGGSVRVRGVHASIGTLFPLLLTFDRKVLGVAPVDCKETREKADLNDPTPPLVGLRGGPGQLMAVMRARTCEKAVEVLP